MNVLVLVVTLATLFSVDALKCRTCMYMEGSSDNDVMKMILDALTKSSNKDCKDSGSSAQDQDCGALPPDSDEWRCGKGDVTTTLNHVAGETSMTADLRFVSRGCAPVKTNEDRYQVGCHPAKDFKDQITSGIGNQAGGPTMGDLSGEFCICEGDNCNSAVGKSPIVLLVLALVSLVYFL